MRFNQVEYAEYYHKQQIDGGYPGYLLPFVMNELKDLSTVLDIGAGTGFFTKPLAESGHFVTAVEPSLEMINIMRKSLSPVTLSLIEICPMPWEEWRGDFHDAAICVHSLYPMPDVKKAITLMNESASRKIIIVRDTSKMRTLSGIVREKLNLLSNRDLNSEIAVILNGLGLAWKVVNIHEERKHIISDIRHEAESISYQLKLDAEYIDTVHSIVKSEIKTPSEEIFFSATYSDNAYIF